jgi:2,3-diketo-5-methylthiopentyl-1-phosphate enolase
MVRKLEDVNMMYAFPEVAFEEDYCIGTFAAKVKTGDIEKLAMAIADEQTTGTWIKVANDSSDKSRAFGGKVVSIYEVPDTASDWTSDEPPMYIIQIAFPKSYIAKFQGPKFGVQGMRDILGVSDRPLLNAMIKPNIGWTPSEGAELFYNAAKGGVDVIKDDELMPANEDFCPLKERVVKFMASEKKAFEETGEHTLYAVNITDNVDKVKENAYKAIEYGTNCLMLNVYTSGFGVLKMLADDPNIKVPLLAHIDYVGATCGSTYTGVNAPLLIGKIVRLSGADFQINGHPFGKFPVPNKVFFRSFKFFTQPWWNIKPMFYAASGGTTQMAVPHIIKAIGTDCILAAGGAVHGHPKGSEAGARSMRQAIDAVMQGVDLVEYARSHIELAQMLAFLNPDIKKNFDLMN